MPKIVKSDEEIRLIYLKNNIRKRMEAKGVTPKQMALYTHMGESTFKRKRNIRNALRRRSCLEYLNGSTFRIQKYLK